MDVTDEPEETELPPVNESELADLVTQFAAVKDSIEDLETLRKKLQNEIVTTMIGADVDTLDVDQVGKVTVVAPERTVIDEQKLAKRLGAAKWKKVTKTTLDRAKLEAAVATGDVDITDVARCSTVEPSTPYVKITNRGRV